MSERLEDVKMAIKLNNRIEQLESDIERKHNAIGELGKQSKRLADEIYYLESENERSQEGLKIIYNETTGDLKGIDAERKLGIVMSIAYEYLLGDVE